MCVFGRQIRDFIPVLPGKYEPHPSWKETLSAREEALRVRHLKSAEKWSEHTRKLPPLAVGDHVRVQNQVGNNPTKWDKTGQVTEVHQHDQYTVRIDGSRRPTLRNRKFLRKFIPLHRQPEPRRITEDLKLIGSPLVPRPTPTTSMETSSPPLSDITRPTSPLTPVVLPPSTTTPNASQSGTPLLTSDTPAVTPAVTPPPTQPLPHPTAAAQPKKMPLALRRLQPFNKKGLLE